jgi:hypothetical protein
MTLFTPPKYIEDKDSPVIFLAGPIQGADNWQKKAAEIISQNKEILIASPRRDIDIDRDFDERVYMEQVDWETYHLNRAAQNGVILFWLANEHRHFRERAYAQTTRFELGEWIAKNKYEEAKVVVGIDNAFTGQKYLLHRLPKENPDIPIFSTLEETCKKAVELALKK